MAQYQSSWYRQSRLVSALVTSGVVIAAAGEYAVAQIKPDLTMGPENSTVTRDVLIKGLLSDRITGGARRGANLFHSFEEFSINPGQGAYFSNPAGIENILSRVTGNSRSNIQGTLGVLGQANLFLLNPNGIIFGPNSSLDVNGSFVATTADAIQFGDQGVFSASDADAPAVLTVNPSAFLFNQLAAQPIIVNSRGKVIGQDDDQLLYAGLQVPARQSLLLLGGNINLYGGSLNALGGRIELGAVAGVGTVGLDIDSNNLDLSFPNDVARANVFLASGSKVNVRAEDRGSIAINARNLDLLGRSAFAAGTVGRGLSAPDRQAGDITLNMTGAVTVADSSFIANHVKNWPVSNTVENRARVKGGNVNITAGLLSVTNGGAVSAGSFGEGDAGNVTIDTRGPVSVDGVAGSGRNTLSSRVVSSVGWGSEGKGGDVNIKAGSLSVTNGGAVITSTFGKGNVGNVTIDTRGPVSVDGVAGSGRNAVSSRAVSAVRWGAEGKGGDVNIKAGSLSVTKGAELSTSIFGRGDAGNVTIDTRGPVSFDGIAGSGTDVPSSGAVARVARGAKGQGGNVNIKADSLSVTEGAVLSTSTFGQGDAGNVTIRADTVAFDGLGDGVGSNRTPSRAVSAVGRGGRGRGGNINIETRSLSVTGGARLSVSSEEQGDAGNVRIRARDTASFDGMSGDFRSLAVSEVEQGAEGNGGNVDIETTSLFVNGGAGLSVSSIGNGAAGNLMVKARSVRLDNQAFLKADTRGGQGNIFLGSQDLVLNRGSDITTNATGRATGGNITIDTGILIGLENSDIRADAEEAFGGRVMINAQGIFGTEFRNQLTPESDITATSDLGPMFSGDVEINRPDVNPSRGLVILPEEVVDVSRLIVQSCSPDADTRANRSSKFVVTGRSGLPLTPKEALRSESTLVDLGTPIQSQADQAHTALSNHSSPSEPTPVVEAQGWAISQKGDVVLTAQASGVTPHSPESKPATCPIP